MSWGTYIKNMLIPGVTFADLGKREELARTLESLRTEALAHAAAKTTDASALAREYEDWKRRFNACVREDTTLAVVETALDDRRYQKDQSRWPKETEGGVLAHGVYYNRISKREIEDCELDWAENPPFFRDQMLALWGIDPAATVAKAEDNEPRGFGERVDDIVFKFRETWNELLEAEQMQVRLHLGRAALEKEPEGSEEG